VECEFPRVNSDRDEIERYLEDTKSIAVVGCPQKLKRIVIE